LWSLVWWSVQGLSCGSVRSPHSGGPNPYWCFPRSMILRLLNYFDECTTVQTEKYQVSFLARSRHNRPGIIYRLYHKQSFALATFSVLFHLLNSPQHSTEYGGLFCCLLLLLMSVTFMSTELDSTAVCTFYCHFSFFRLSTCACALSLVVAVPKRHRRCMPLST
jgi:hypothetical protein